MTPTPILEVTMAMAVATILTLTIGTSEVLAQSDGELVVGDWHCAVGSSPEPMFFQFLDDEKAEMYQLHHGLQQGRATTGTWNLDDVDYDDQDRPVITLKVVWTGNRNASQQKIVPKEKPGGQMTVKLVLISEDEMEVYWSKEPMRKWTRIKTADQKANDNRN